MSFSQLDKAIIRELQEDIPLTAEPYKEIADKLGISEDVLLEKINEYKDKGYLRRFGAALRHRKMGLKANPMIVWRVPDSKIEEVGRELAKFPQVTHCYQRPTLPKFNYNMFSMVHGESYEECYALAREMAAKVGINEYQLLFSQEEFKKTSMKYFVEARTTTE